MTYKNHRLGNAEPSDQPDNAGDIADTLPENTPDERKHNINESHDKIRAEIDFTRGTGTRDQEKHKLKARGETPEEAAEMLSKTLSELEDRDVFKRARGI